MILWRDHKESNSIDSFLKSVLDLKWKNVKNNSYVKNEFALRPEKALPLPKNMNITKTLYGYKPRRNQWVSKELLNKSAAIPFVGLKK